MKYYKTANQCCAYVKKENPISDYLDKSKGYIWLQRLSLWVLDKIGVKVIEKEHYTVDDYNTEIIDVDHDNILALVQEQNQNIRLIMENEADTIVLGKKQIEKLHGTSFYINYDIPPYGSIPATLWGLTVHYVPWVDDCCIVLPRKGND